MAGPSLPTWTSSAGTRSLISPSRKTATICSRCGIFMTGAAAPETYLVTPVRSPALDLQLFQHLIVGPFGPSNPISLQIGAGPHLVQLPNDTRDMAMQLPASGATVTAALDRYGAANWYRAR